jgi:ribosomal protein S18 acetylase RimI-like enzyme
MLQYVTIRKYKHLNKLNNLWNSEYKKTFPIKKYLFKKHIVEDVNLNKDASFVALYDNEPVGFVFVKTWLLDSGLLDKSDVANISLIYVKKEMRNMGIGSDMLNLALAEIKKHTTIKKVVVGNDVNFLFAGIPSDINNSSIFFINKGFQQKENVVDMIRVLREDSFDDFDKKGLNISIATEEEKDELLKLCISNSLHEEAYKINQYFENGGTGRRIAIGSIDDKIVAFVRFNDKNALPFKVNSFLKDKKIGSILYVCVDEKYKDAGYDEVMSRVARRYLVKRGCKKVVILATKNIQFYKKQGFSALRFYQQFEMEI